MLYFKMIRTGSIEFMSEGPGVRVRCIFAAYYLLGVLVFPFVLLDILLPILWDCLSRCSVYVVYVLHNEVEYGVTLCLNARLGVLLV